MADDGLEFSTSEYTFQDKKLNRKTLFVGNTTQIADLTPTTGGMLIMPTNTSGAYPNEFVVDGLYSRLANNSEWSRKLQESGEFFSGFSYGTATYGADSSRYYHFWTMPSGPEKFFRITAVEWKNGTSASANLLAGVDLVNANKPTLDHTVLIALCQQKVQTGTNSIQKVSVVWSKPIKPSAKVGAWLRSDNAAGQQTSTSGALGVAGKSPVSSITPPFGDDGAWFTATNPLDINIYYRGYI